MSGKIMLDKRGAVTHISDYNNYYEWFLHVKDENEKDEVKLSPFFSDLSQLWVDVFLHEFKNDVVRQRKPQFKERSIQVIRYIEEALYKCEKLKLDDIPDDYYKHNAINENGEKTEKLKKGRNKKELEKRLKKLQEKAKEIRRTRLKRVKRIKTIYCSKCGNKIELIE